jgi:hypothetical protein
MSANGLKVRESQNSVSYEELPPENNGSLHTRNLYTPVHVKKVVPQKYLYHWKTRLVENFQDVLQSQRSNFITYLVPQSGVVPNGNRFE